MGMIPRRRLDGGSEVKLRQFMALVVTIERVDKGSMLTVLRVTLLWCDKDFSNRL